ncbi:MAG: sigma-70 family RNA polymerase sigma factor [Verrucomicrobia bacterium]|nr:sigma-70 family RNA polymerase sigma factor [Verrucomicrobiota bacterium]
MEELDDAGLMRLAAGGDERAFEILVERHQNMVVGTAAKMLGGVEGAEDLAQQVFLRAWQAAGRYRPTAKFTTWLLTITRNLVFNECRRRMAHRTVSLDDPDSGLPERACGGAAGAEALHERELERAVDAAIAALPESQRLAVVLRRFEAMPYGEIAEVLGTSVPAVKSLLFRARADLQVRLKGYLAEG